MRDVRSFGSEYQRTNRNRSFRRVAWIALSKDIVDGKCRGGRNLAARGVSSNLILYQCPLEGSRRDISSSHRHTEEVWDDPSAAFSKGSRLLLGTFVKPCDS